MGKPRNLERFTNEVAPPRYVSVSRRLWKKTLATIAEEETDFSDDEVVKGRRTCASPMCGKETSCLSRPLESSMLLFLMQMAKTN
ncbi:hypothetical protein HRI_004207200 [Hibiscus trionum]|uniref:Uncharacterized protein n=1 Tax=Hibiscus trionum TaxID=183268 RepID=A0A9W7MMY7_HIBTR|nr:hypothetical protein HRI_004207200 [Hibiscus trionum]